jgi:ATP-dependent DNA helicase RecG
LGNFIDNQQIYGNAFRLLEEADAFLRRHLSIASFFNNDQFKRIDKPALPVIAIREALINAICHRDYSNRGTDISLAVYADRIEIWNSGSLMKDLTIKSLKQKHSSVLRNKLIANVFYVRGMIEKWGRGINTMIDACKVAELPEPSFEEYSGGIEVTLKFAKPISPVEKITRDHISPPLSQRQQDILRIIQNHKAVNIQQIMSKLENPPTQRMVRNDLNKLRDLGLIFLKGHTHQALWFVNDKLRKFEET